MKLQTINSSRLTWTIHPSQHSDVSEVYCADGDGLVSVSCDFFGDLQGIYATLEEALAKGEALLLEYYPEIYEEAMFWDKEAQS